ncbi:universal stress protein [Entomospira entomophila]|uniref:Universal stress protein n=1 Tax=Entomospira entomophila TaxID=2719988 RepID=A0A968KR70_9SPIO|nr:universal stress protein [Entomospira entomophilus]NIZ40438.1 universal stress protein [Entomospira entomophilus]WDI35996.1 universal stress protein [Entomospira entomophilus]
MKITPKILVYIDGTEEALTAMRYAVYMAKIHQMELYGIHVINTKALNDLVNAKIFLQMEQAEYLSDMQADAHKHLDELIHLAERKGVPVHPLIEEGDVYKEVMQAIKQEEVDILVLGELSPIRTRRDDQHNDMERLVRNAPCSIFLVKDKKRVNHLYSSI